MNNMFSNCKYSQEISLFNNKIKKYNNVNNEWSIV